MLNCRQATRLLSEKQERTLSTKERLTLQLHLLWCDGCKNFSLQMPFLRQTMRAYSERLDTVLAEAEAEAEAEPKPTPGTDPQGH